MRNLVAFALLAVGLAFAMAGCQKEGCTDSKASNYDPYAKKDNGTCVYTTPQPDPTDTIVIPTKEKTFDVDWNVDSYGSPSVDSIKKYADDSTYKYIFINLMNKGSSSPNGQEGCLRTSSPARGFARACDSLQTRFDISDKVHGSGTIIVNSEVGASLPDDAYEELGMRKRDSLKLTEWGIGVERLR